MWLTGAPLERLLVLVFAEVVRALVRCFFIGLFDFIAELARFFFAMAAADHKEGKDNNRWMGYHTELKCLHVGTWRWGFERGGAPSSIITED